jgi:riboflavin biosynthesis pyrimidine reductase
MAVDVKRNRAPRAVVLEAGRMIAVSGGPSIVPALLQADLVDEPRRTVHPVALGSSRRLVEQRHRFPLESTQRFDSGAVAPRCPPPPDRTAAL